MKKKATLTDIAEVLDLTKVSVSKALRNHPDISEATKAKVKEVARELGYRPNLIARSLTSSKSRTLGVVVPKIAHNFFAHVVAGIQNQASQHDYKIVLTVSEEKEELECRNIEALVSMQVEGLLVSVSMETKNLDVYEWIRDLQVPLVFFDRHLPGLGFNSVVIDDEYAAMTGVEKLIKTGSGKRKIAHLSGFDYISIGRNRRLGYERALERSGIPVDPDLIVEGGFGEEDGFNGFRELMARGVVPDALFAVTVPVSYGACIAMREADPGLIDRIPVMAFGDSTLRNILPYPQYYIHQPGITIGETAAGFLLKEIAGKVKPENQVEVVETRFIETEKEFPAWSL